jgi:segregation and condensation protein B
VCLLTATDPLTLEQLSGVFNDTFSFERLTDIINQISQRYANSGLELLNLSTGFRFRSKIEFIAYRQPVTRGEIEDIRGVTLNSTAIQTILERGWIEVIGQKQIPGRPELLATTTKFLEDFGISSLHELPLLPSIDNTQFASDDDIIEEYDNAKNNRSNIPK